MQSVALYGAELWWKGQKNYEKDLQKLINRQARSITGMYRSSLISPLMNDSGLIPAHILLDSRQRAYAHRLLTLPDSIPTKHILPVTLRSGDSNAQLEDLPEYDSIGTTNERIRTYGQHLAKQVSVGFSIDPAEGVEPISARPAQVFPGKIFIEEKSRATDIAKSSHADLNFWCDGSKLDQGGAGAAVVWKENRDDNLWTTQKVSLGKNKEILDAEIWGISEAIKIAEKKCMKFQQPLAISIFCDSQTAINQLRIMDNKACQALKVQIYQKVEQMVRQKHEISLCWVPSHCKIEGNEKADLAAKEAAGEERIRTAKWTSLAHIKKRINKEKTAQLTAWHNQRLKEREIRKSGFYIASFKAEIDPLLSKTKKYYASRFYQLKIGHGPIGTFLEQIGAAKSAECWWCGAAEQSVIHLYTKCRKWRTKRRARALRKT